MRKMLVGFAVLVAVALGVARPAEAHVSIAIGLPGFGFFLGSPYLSPPVVYAPPPVVYGPPIAYAPPVVYGPPAVYYRPPVYYRRPVYYAPRYYGHDHGWHRGWYKHDD